MPKKKYPISQSCFYKLQSKRKLFEILNIERSRLANLLDDKTSYRVFTLNEGGKQRLIEEPVGELRRLHDRLLSLFSRIELPPYLHSGVKGRSYLSNAKAHTGNGKILKTDVKKFFPTTTHHQVFVGLLTLFKCAGDVAKLLADLCTYQGHVPTGSPISMPVAFIANKQLFDGLYIRMQQKGVRLTIYVDDITISAPSLTRLHFCPIKGALRGAGHHAHKTRFFGAKPALVTGVIVKGNDTVLPNRRHLKIIQGIKSLDSPMLDEARSRIATSLIGQINEAANVDLRCRARALEYRKLVNCLLSAYSECRL
jgi:Reverse transcriptase (RNA-dependent DNA polymerase)